MQRVPPAKRERFPMEFETTSNGFILKVNADVGPTIEWNASEDEVTILLPILDKDGKLDSNSRRVMIHVRRHANMSPSVEVYPL